jgi:subtilisin family serine protease
LNRDGFGDDEDAMKGIHYATTHGAAVINLSFAAEGYDQDFYNVLKEAADHNVVVVAAAGNDSLNNDRNGIYPANFQLPNLISVAATNEKDELWEGSDWGHKNVHIAAPGANILGPWIDGTWDTGNGTSFAAPIVAGAAGLIRSVNPRLKAQQVIRILMKTARKVPALDGKVASGGIVNVRAAVECAADEALPCLH